MAETKLYTRGDTTQLYICVSAGYEIQRLYEDEAVEDYESNLTEDQTKGKKLHDIAAAALKKFPSIVSFMRETRSEMHEYDVNMIEDLANENGIEFDRWNPIFECSTMLEALTMFPKIMKICKKLSWCHIWEDQEFDRIKTFPLNDGTVVFLTLEAESG